MADFSRRKFLHAAATGAAAAAAHARLFVLDRDAAIYAGPHALCNANGARTADLAALFEEPPR